MAKQIARVRADALRRFVRDVFAAVDMPPGDAETVADVLVWANLRGVDSHGVVRVPRYLEFIELGYGNPRPDMRVAGETPASLLIDADRAFGPVAMTFAMDKVVAKARAAGVGWGVVRGLTHAGAVGYYTLMAARADMAGIAITTSLPNMAYHGARAAGVATSPLAIAVPGALHPPLMLDMATSVASAGKLKQIRESGERLPDGWALDRDGNPAAFAEDAVLPMPLGGAKGAGLSLMFECLAGLMADNPLIEPSLTRGNEPGAHRSNGVVAAIDIAAFTDPGRYRERVDALVAALKTLPRADGTDEILAPGERGDRILGERERNGIPLPAGTWRSLSEVAGRLGVDLPEAG